MASLLDLGAFLVDDGLDFKIMFLGGVIGRRGIAIQLPPSGLAKNIILKSIYSLSDVFVKGTPA
jgi:hypothetical protein